jgi:hypothetical protein
MDVKSSGGMNCPRCGGPVAVGSSTVMMPGLLWIIISALSTTYSCPKCGTIPFGEFPPDVQASERSNMWLKILGALGLFVLIIVVVVLIIVFTGK